MNDPIPSNPNRGSLAFSEVLSSMGFSSETIQGLRDVHCVTSFQHLRLREEQLHWAELEGVPRGQQPRLKFLLFYLAELTPQVVDFDQWLMTNELSREGFEQHIVKHYPHVHLPPKLIRKWLQDKKDPNPKVISIDSEEDALTCTLHLREAPDLTKCTFCERFYEWRGLRKCSGCQKVTCCSCHCQRQHWKSGHCRFCGK